jgi:hypothetical protein
MGQHRQRDFDSCRHSLPSGLDGPTAAAVGVLWPAASTARKLKPSFVVQAANTGEQTLPAEMQGWVDAAKAAYKRGDPGENLWLQQQVVG